MVENRFMSVTVVDHPLAQHYLTLLRDQETYPERFRRVARNLTTVLVLEATRQMAQKQVEVHTPLTKTKAPLLGEGLAAVPILRAGLSMLEPVLELFPDVAVGYVGLERHEDTAVARSYYMKLPKLDGRFTLCLDPMLATGGSAAQAIGQLKVAGAKQVVMVCVIASPEGIAFLQSQHPDVPIVTASVDECLNDKKYIVPGLGDFGDRLYGTM
jgi:uracil phosphoribosyltransferase